MIDSETNIVHGDIFFSWRAPGESGGGPLAVQTRPCPARGHISASGGAKAASGQAHPPSLANAGRSRKKRLYSH